MAKRNWLITGVSSGIGLALAKAVLARGDRVAGTVRSDQDAQAFRALSADDARPVRVDLAEPATVPAAVAGLVQEIGPIDVLVNNAGYSLYGALEELSPAAIAHQINTNLHGPIALMQALLPSMRERRDGRIINISSIAGVIGFPGQPAYCASKFALNGLSEALAGEVAQFGIRVTLVEPGGFRTEWTGRSMKRPENMLSCYDDVTGRSRQNFEKLHGHQQGDPERAAKVIIDLADHPEPPVHLLLGKDALKYVRGYLAGRLKSIDALESISASTDYA
ncbi:MAG: oxidoreductase [Gammaproteobacteria bacterium]